MIETATKFVVLKVNVEHEQNANVIDICEEAELICDAQDGAITKSEVIGVYDTPPGDERFYG